ncbi:PadR family transcriptional regulator [Pasteurellaceae bacterium LIM206]|nr:PadR family transcriptional regulator [Pasteurellaceae bacterium LIM206]
MKKNNGKRILKFVILALLNRRPMTGYDITTEFKNVLGEFWSAKHSQIYVELSKLVEENLIHQQIEFSGKIEKKSYFLTALGKEELQQWLLLDEESSETEKDVFALRLYFLQQMPREAIPAFFNRQLQLKQQRLAFLYSQLREHFGDDPDPMRLEQNDLSHYFVLTKAISREKSYVEWLQESWEIMERYLAR